MNIWVPFISRGAVVAYGIYVHVKKNIAAWKEIRMGSSGRLKDWLILPR